MTSPEGGYAMTGQREEERETEQKEEKRRDEQRLFFFFFLVIFESHRVRRGCFVSTVLSNHGSVVDPLTMFPWFAFAE